MKLSIIIPVYNKVRYLSRILQQIEEQNFYDYECLLIDDGSTDGSGIVCDHFAEKDDRFRVFHIPNGGVSHARNVGLEEAKGQYITFIDADDGIESGYLYNLICCAEKSGAELVISGYKKVDSEGKILQCIIPSKIGLMLFSKMLCEFAKTQLTTGVYGCCVAKIFPRSLVERIRFNENIKLAEDFDFYLNLYEVIDTVYFDDGTGYLYLQDAENSTGKIQSEKIDFLSQVHIMLHYREVMKKRNAFSGENQKIIEERLNDYIYFVLFHTKEKKYVKNFDILYSFYKNGLVSLDGERILRKWLFFCVRHKLCYMAKETMHLYRGIRRIINGEK